MADMGAQDDLSTQERPDWRRLFATLVVGGLVTAICFILDWWWVGTAFLLVTLLGACFAFSTKLRPVVFTVFAVFAVAWLTGSLLDQFLPVEAGSDSGWRFALAVVSGIVAGVALPVLFWFLVFLASTEWLMSVSETHAISKQEALRFVAARTFGTAQAVFVVENGKLTVEKPKEVLSKLGGPGVLIVRSGNAVVLERGSRISRVLGPGTYKLMPGENFKRPQETKGIIDLRGGGGGLEVENVLTKDGIPLKFKIGGGYQLEPKSETDKRPSSRFEGGEATTPVIGAPEYPVYEATIRKAVNNTGDGGLKDMYPKGAVDTLRDVVASYTFDQIFPPNPTPEDDPDPDNRLIKQIENKVKASIDASWRGVLFRGIDIQEISMPDDVREKMMDRWAEPLERDLRIREARTTSRAIIVESKAKAKSIELLDRARLDSSLGMAKIVKGLATELPKFENEAVAEGFWSLVRDLASRIGRDAASASHELEVLRDLMRGPSVDRSASPGTRPMGVYYVPPPALAAPQDGGYEDESRPEEDA